MAANPSGKLSATSALYASSCWALLRPKSELIDGSFGFQFINVCGWFANHQREFQFWRLCQCLAGTWALKAMAMTSWLRWPVKRTGRRSWWLAPKHPRPAKRWRRGLPSLMARAEGKLLRAWRLLPRLLSEKSWTSCWPMAIWNACLPRQRLCGCRRQGRGFAVVNLCAVRRVWKTWDGRRVWFLFVEQMSVEHALPPGCCDCDCWPILPQLVLFRLVPPSAICSLPQEQSEKVGPHVYSGQTALEDGEARPRAGRQRQETAVLAFSLRGHASGVESMKKGARCCGRSWSGQWSLLLAACVEMTCKLKMSNGGQFYCQFYWGWVNYFNTSKTEASEFWSNEDAPVPVFRSVAGAVRLSCFMMPQWIPFLAGLGPQTHGHTALSVSWVPVWHQVRTFQRGTLQWPLPGAEICGSAWFWNIVARFFGQHVRKVLVTPSKFRWESWSAEPHLHPHYRRTRWLLEPTNTENYSVFGCAAFCASVDQSPNIQYHLKSMHVFLVVFNTRGKGLLMEEG